VPDSSCCRSRSTGRAARCSRAARDAIWKPLFRLVDGRMIAGAIHLGRPARRRSRRSDPWSGCGQVRSERRSLLLKAASPINRPQVESDKFSFSVFDNGGGSRNLGRSAWSTRKTLTDTSRHSVLDDGCSTLWPFGSRPTTSFVSRWATCEPKGLRWTDSSARSSASSSESRRGSRPPLRRR
jgi:hypothetical protein